MKSHSQPNLCSPFHREMGEKISAYGSALQILDAFENAKKLTVTNTTNKTNTVIELQDLNKPYKISELVLAILKNLNYQSIDADIETSIIIDMEQNNLFKMAIKTEKNNDCHHVHIERVINNEIALDNSTSDVKQSPSSCKLKIDKSKSMVMLHDKEFMTESSKRPKGLQSDVIRLFGDSLQEGNIARLLLMATGSGKSFVIAGVSHAIGHGVYVVPNQTLAKELEKDAIKELHGSEANIAYSTQFKDTESFAKALLIIPHMIMIADDPMFAEKSVLIENNIVLIDEAHQHTYTESGLRTLEKIKHNNIVLSLTGTPTSPLYKIFKNEPLADINIRKVMDIGAVRHIHGKTDIASEEDLIELLLQNYFGRSEFVDSGIGYLDPLPVKTSLMKTGLSEKAAEKKAIEMAIENNRERAIDEKNFIFTGDKKMRELICKTYNDVANDKYHDQPELIVHIRKSLHDCELEEKARIIHQFHPEKKFGQIKSELEQEVTFKAPISLAKIIKQSQKKQINNTINAWMLNILFPEKSAREFELLMRTSQLSSFTNGKFNSINISEYFSDISEKNIRTFLDTRFLTNLPKNQRDILITEITQATLTAITNIKNGQTSCDKFLHKDSDVKLDQLEAKYIVIAPEQSQPDNNKEAANKEADQILDQLRAGLVMHVISDERFSTGISIPSVLSCQQLIYSSNDKLNDPVLITQLFGRTVRDKDRVAIIYQLINKNKVEDIEGVLKPEHIIATNSGALVKDTYDKIESSTKSFLTRTSNFHQQVNMFGASKKQVRNGEPVEKEMVNTNQRGATFNK